MEWLTLPFSSARVGRRPPSVGAWWWARTGRPLSSGNTLRELAAAMYTGLYR